MTRSAIELLQRYRKAGVLVDTNLLLLYFVGSFDPQQIRKFKRTIKYSEEDYSMLVNFLGRFEKVVTTPNILTEINSFSGQLAEYVKTGYFEKFANGIAVLDECYLPSAEIATMQEFRRFGLTDAGVVRLAKSNYLVLTDEHRLSGYLEKAGVDVLNFNHIRWMNWK